MKLLYFVFSLFVFVDSQSNLGLHKGDICKNQGKNAWKCEHINNCPQIGDFKKKHPTICSFEGIYPIICCPPPARNVNNSSKLIVSNGNAKKNCLQNTRNYCNDLIRVRRAIGLRPVIVGGTRAKPRVHKAMVLIGYGQANAKSWNCGGSLIAKRWVLSAAHCANPRGQGLANWARVGELDLSSTTEDARPQEKSIIERIIHPNYKEPAVYNDIVLFKLDSDVTFNDWVQPICLNTDKDIKVSKATVTGWGRLDFVGDVSSTLQEAEISLVNASQCQRLYIPNTKIPRGIVGGTMICAGEREGGKDACSGDSGGPLIIHPFDTCLKKQIGITSFGKECALPNTPGVYTKVSYYIPWIESIVWPN